MKNADSEDMKQKSIRIIQEVCTQFDDLTKKENTQLLIVLQPSLSEFENGKYLPFFGQLEIAKFLKSKEINYLELSFVFKKKGKSLPEYYYPLDTHFNKKGYALFGKTVYEKIETLCVFD